MTDIVIHDTPQAFRLQVTGRLEDGGVRELELCWATAQSTIGERAFEVDLTGLDWAGQEGKRLLARMCRAGARFTAATPAVEALLAEVTCKAHAPAAQPAHRPALLRRLRRFALR